MTNLIEQAISKASTVWLKNFLTSELPKLPTEPDGCRIWFDSLIDTFEGRSLVEPKQQKNFLTQVRNAIKVINPEHPALDIVKFEKSTWVKINNAATEGIAERDTKFISDPESIVAIGKKLVGSFEWSSIAAGLAVLTGRRSSEVIKTAVFKYKSKYSVIFSGSIKRKSEPIDVVFEIPTLCEAELVIKAVANLREMLGAEIEGLSLRQISGRYSRAVSKKCDEHFQDLVPRRQGEDNLYTHLFRAVYGTIASHWYCPPTVPEMEYRAGIQGHYQILDEKDPVLRRSLEAGRHYFDYKISDGRGNIDGRLGIKLGKPGVEVIEQFARTDSPKASNSDKRMQKGKKIKMNQSITIPGYLTSRLRLLAEKLEMDDRDALEALFDWAEVSLSLADVLDIDELKPHVLYDQVEELKAEAKSSQSLGRHNQAAVGGIKDKQLSLDAESIQDLCSSIRLLSQTVYDEKSSNHSGRRKVVSSRTAPRTNSSSSDNSESESDSESDGTDGRKNSTRTQEAELVINHAIDKFIEYNEQEGIAHQDKFRIGIGAVRKVTRRGDGVIKRVLESRASEIEQHNQKHQLGVHHNSKGKDATSVDELIFLDEDYLDKQISNL